MLNPKTSLLLLASVLLLGQTVNSRKLTIDKLDALKIVVFSDLLIDDDGTNYAYTMQLLQKVLDAENRVLNDTKVDLVVFMGDTVDPDFEESYTNRFEEAVAYLKMLDIPWVSVGGVDRPGNFITRDYMIKAE